MRRQGLTKRALQTAFPPEALEPVKLQSRRGYLSKTRHFFYGFPIPPAASSLSSRHYPDKTQLRETILALRAEGQSYRAIAREVGLHWTRIGQILKAIDTERSDEPA